MPAADELIERIRGRLLPSPQLAEETATLAAPHNWGSHLSRFYIAQFALACPRFAMVEVDRQTMPGVDDGGYGWVDGAITVPEAPGFGLSLDEDVWQALLREEGAWAL